MYMRPMGWGPFVQRVLDHMSSQDKPIGGNPPTYGDLFRGKTRDGPLGPWEDHLTRNRAGSLPLK